MRTFTEESALAKQVFRDDPSAFGLLYFSHLHQAGIAMMLGEPARVERVLEEEAPLYAEHLAARAVLKLQLGFAWLEVARREARPEDAQRARESLEAALADTELSERERTSGTLRLAELELEQHHLERARELWRSADAALAAQGASKSREMRRSRVLAARLALESERDSVELVRLRDELSDELDAFLDEWRAIGAREGGYGLMHHDLTLSLFNEFTRLALATEGDEVGARHAFAKLMEAHAASSLARRLSAPAPTLEELRDVLVSDAGHGALVYLAGPARSYVFALDRERLTVHEIADEFAIERARRVLVGELLATGGGVLGSEACSASRTLAAELLPPDVRARIATWRTVGACGLDLFLGDVPFEALDLGDGRMLGVDRATYVLPSLAVGAALARESTRALGPLTAVRLLAMPVVAPRIATEYELAPLELSDRAIDDVLAAYPEELRAIVRRGDARPGAMLGSGSDGVQVLQILAHGVRNETNPHGASFALTPEDAQDDGLFDARDVERTYANRAAPAVVVATACRAGSGAQRRGDAAATDLVGAFLGAGSRVVLASSYDIDLEVARRLSKRFHAELWSGASPAEALRIAREELLGDPQFAALAQPLLVRIVGLGGASPFTRIVAKETDGEHTRWFAALAVGLTVVVVLAGVWMRRRA
ncbi:MAG: CHAT domain-containing protein [Planctomycetes bacterium]|nr:CHAT domain-containing protein [Planctomycetota bacterium]